MWKYILKKLIYGLLVLAGVVVLVFFLFQGFGDPSRIVMGQSGDSTTQSNIRKELYLIDAKGDPIPKFRQLLYYINDVSPLCIHSRQEIQAKKLKGLFIGGDKKIGLKLPYLRKSYQSKREVSANHCSPKLKTATSTITRALAFAENNGVINRCFQKRKPIRIVSTKSLRNEAFELMTRQSPKQPQLVGLPVT